MYNNDVLVGESPARTCYPLYLCSLMLFILVHTYMFSFLITIIHTVKINVTMSCYTKGYKLIIDLYYCCFHQIFYFASGSRVNTAE